MQSSDVTLRIHGLIVLFPLNAGEKRAALLAEVSRLREGGSGEPDSHNAPLQPCRGTISISSIQLPLKVEFVCSARTGISGYLLLKP